MIIKEIELNNFRIYKGPNVIDLSLDENKNIFIISGRTVSYTHLDVYKRQDLVILLQISFIDGVPKD